MASDQHEFWPWRETTSIYTTGRHFKAKFLDEHGSPMTKQFAVDGFGDDQLRELLAGETAKLEAEGATFPERALWV